MMSELDRLKAQRRRHREVATKHIQELKGLFRGESRDDSVYRCIRSLRTSIEEKVKVLEGLDKETL